jgi:hypothetical protein
LGLRQRASFNFRLLKSTHRCDLSVFSRRGLFVNIPAARRYPQGSLRGPKERPAPSVPRCHRAGDRRLVGQQFSPLERMARDQNRGPNRNDPEPLAKMVLEIDGLRQGLPRPGCKLSKLHRCQELGEATTNERSPYFAPSSRERPSEIPAKMRR